MLGTARNTFTRSFTLLTLIVLLYVVFFQYTEVVHASPAPPIGGGDQLDTNTPVLFIHGIGGIPIGGVPNHFDCQADWGKMKSYLQQGSFTSSGTSFHWSGPLNTIGYYAGDTNCDTNLSQYQSHCTHTFDPMSGTDVYGNIGTHNESIQHLSCELAWYISSHWGSRYVNIVAHSMGGLIVRWAIYGAQQHVSFPSSYFPDYPPALNGGSPVLVKHVVTLDTPHGGLLKPESYVACKGCTEAVNMEYTDLFMKEMSEAQAPSSNGRTIWTLVGSVCKTDSLYQFGTDKTSVYMSNAFKFLIISPCLEHGDLPGDSGPPSTSQPNYDTICEDTYFNTNPNNPRPAFCDLTQTFSTDSIDDSYHEDALLQVSDPVNDAHDPGAANWKLMKKGPHTFKIVLLTLLDSPF